MICSCSRCADNAANKVVTAESGRTYRRCDGCKGPIPRYEGMDGHGFEAHSTDHLVRYTDLGKPVDRPVHLELCYDCFKADFEKFYPGKAAPVIANVEVTRGR